MAVSGQALRRGWCLKRSPTGAEVVRDIAQELLGCGLALEEVVDGKHAGDHVERAVGVIQVSRAQAGRLLELGLQLEPCA